MKRYDSAYPGSMFEKPEGSYVKFEDATSELTALRADVQRLNMLLSTSYGPAKQNLEDAAIEIFGKENHALRARVEALEEVRPVLQAIVEHYNKDIDVDDDGSLSESWVRSWHDCIMNAERVLAALAACPPEAR